MVEKISGPERCAILLISLGMEQASSILQKLESQEATKIAAAARKLKDVDPNLVNQIVLDFHGIMAGQSLLSGEGSNFIQAALQHAGANAKDPEVVNEMGLVPTADGDVLGKMLQQEHPQTIAVVLGNVDSIRGSRILHALTPEKQAEVMKRLAGLATVPNSVLRKIEKTLLSQLERCNTESVHHVKGIDLAAGILKLLNKDDSGSILEKMSSEDSKLATDVKQLMFTFDDLMALDDRGIRNLLKEVDSAMLCKALKIADDALKSKFFKNMSQRAAAMLEEDIASLPPMRLTDVEESQKLILDVALTLVQDGKAIIMRGLGDQVV